MSDMVEKIARAICAKDWLNDFAWAALSDVSKERFRRQARAAIETLKEPDVVMKAAAARIPHASDEEIYRAMLDAALAP